MWFNNKGTPVPPLYSRSQPPSWALLSQHPPCSEAASCFLLQLKNSFRSRLSSKLSSKVSQIIALMMSSPKKCNASTLKSSIEKDRVYSQEDWLRKSKDFLRQRCSRYGLPTFGKKARLAQRLMAYLHQPSFSISGSSPSTSTIGAGETSSSSLAAPSVPTASTTSSQGAHNDIAEAVAASAAPAQAVQAPAPLVSAHIRPEAVAAPHQPVQSSGSPASAAVVTVHLEELRALIREEVSLQNGSQHQSQQAGANFAASFPLQSPPSQQLSLASVHNPPQLPTPRASAEQAASSISNPAYLAAVNPSTPQLQLPSESEASQAQTGNLLQLSPCSQLPPLSAKVQKALKNKEYVDLSSLLPNNLYDSASSPMNFQFSTGDDQNTRITTVSAPTAQKPKITSMPQWLEAWNIFIRGMVHFHPSLAPQLLSYQESMCTLMRSYQFTACYRYDVAARLNIASNKGARWDNFYDYAFNRFIRCANVSTLSNPVKCYKCLKEGHFSSSCPNGTFRAPVSTANHKNPFHLYCRSFNSGNRCVSDCAHPHRCNKCGQGHPGFSCRRINGKF